MLEYCGLMDDPFKKAPVSGATYPHHSASHCDVEVLGLAGLAPGMSQPVEAVSQEVSKHSPTSFLDSCPRAAVTNCHKLGASNSVHWSSPVLRLGVQSQGVGRAALPRQRREGGPSNPCGGSRCFSASLALASPLQIPCASLGPLCLRCIFSHLSGLLPPDPPG
jgi:hypothetical protein